MTVKQLREEAKKLGIVGRWDMTKSELEKAIKEKQEAPSQGGKEATQKYIDTAPVGTIVAFKIELKGREKTLSGKLQSTDSDSVTVVTKRGSTYKVPRQKVVWVKTGTRWPKGVFNELKGEAHE